MKYTVKSVLLASLLLGACQDDITTPFPPGLEPLEDNEVPDSDVPTVEDIAIKGDSGATIRVYGRGLIFSSPADVWVAEHFPEWMVARCSTDDQTVTETDDPAYEFSFSVHYFVDNIVNVEWDDQWRYGVIEGTQDAPTFGMIRHQKTQGSDFIDISEGSIQLHATDDPNVTELDFVEHLNAVEGSVGDVSNGMRDNYNRLVAALHDAPKPSCP
ncbi:MAG TPA: hypothetical protein VGM39_01085 [Kofleriaceae bacterium]|jgi:hypothetical protein